MQQDSLEGLCPHCGADVKWILAGSARETVMVTCAECGQFEISRAEFQQAQFDLAAAEERRE